MAQNRMMPPALLGQLQGADTDVLRRVLEHAMQRLTRPRRPRRSAPAHTSDQRARPHIATATGSGSST